MGLEEAVVNQATVWPESGADRTASSRENPVPSTAPNQYNPNPIFQIGNGFGFFIDIGDYCKMPPTTKRALGTDTKNRLSIPISLFFARPLLGSVIHLHRTAGLKYSRQSFLLPMFVHEPLIDA